jgi:DNA-directed RNA polymerase subunit RPC12/RpoP
MDLFHRKKNICDQCGEKFESYNELIIHSRYVHHHPIVKCQYCGKEFIHESVRLQHAREEHQKELEYRTHRDEYTCKVKVTQKQIDKYLRIRLE